MTHTADCPKCHGRGVILVADYRPPGIYGVRQIPCPRLEEVRRDR